MSFDWMKEVSEETLMDSLDSTVSAINHNLNEHIPSCLKHAEEMTVNLIAIYEEIIRRKDA